MIILFSFDWKNNLKKKTRRRRSSLDWKRKRSLDENRRSYSTSSLVARKIPTVWKEDLEPAYTKANAYPIKAAVQRVDVNE